MGSETCDWFEWFALFTASIGSDPSLTNLQKFCKLKTFMTDKAAQVIAGITLSDANYAIATNALQTMFGNVEVYKIKLLKELDNLPACHNFSQASAFRLNVDRICRLLSNIDPLNVDVESCHVYLKLETKLTIPIQREIQIKRDEITLAHHAGGPPWNTTRFRPNCSRLDLIVRN